MRKVRDISDEERSTLYRMINQILDDKQAEAAERRSSFFPSDEEYAAFSEEEKEERDWMTATVMMDDLWDVICTAIDEYSKMVGRELLEAKWGDHGIEVWRVQ